jgi:hypothetical protein
LQGAANGSIVALKIEHRLGVQVPPEVVWEIIADVPGWAAWNPLYPQAAGRIGYGELLTLTLALPDQPARVITPRIVDWAPQEAVHWRLSMMGGLVSSIRYLEIEPVGDGGCIFSNGEIFSGLLGPRVVRPMRRAIKQGFTAMGEAVRDRALAQWRGPPAEAT